MSSFISGSHHDGYGEEPVEEYPWYFQKGVLTSEDLSTARKSWKLIRDNKSPEYIANARILPPSCGIWTCSLFYKHLFEVAPETVVLFKGIDMESQAMMLLQMISYLIGYPQDDDDDGSYTIILRNLATRHVGYGVKAHQFGIMGEVLLVTLKRVLGSEFTEETSKAWIRVYSSFLETIIPAAVAEEKRIWLAHRVPKVDSATKANTKDCNDCCEERSAKAENGGQCQCPFFAHKTSNQNQSSYHRSIRDLLPPRGVLTPTPETSDADSDADSDGDLDSDDREIGDSDADADFRSAIQNHTPFCNWKQTKNG
jgi:hemoglobin-like flavoprotein